MIISEVRFMAKKKTIRKKVTVKPAAPRKGAVAGPKGELIGMLEQLNNNDIKWLITQAKTMIYNQKVDAVNEAARELLESKKRTGSETREKKTKTEVQTVDIIQAGSPKNFNILLGNARLFINLKELKSMVKIAEAADDAGDGAGRLFRWCSRERKDIILDGSIAGPGDPRLRIIHKILRDRYTVS